MKMLLTFFLVFTFPVSETFDFEKFLAEAQARGVSLVGTSVNGHATQDGLTLTVTLAERAVSGIVSRRIGRSRPSVVPLGSPLIQYQAALTSAVQAAQSGLDP